MVTTREIEYQADGITMRGHLALPAGSGLRPAVLIAPDGPGLSDQQKGQADALAALGCVSFALDYHGDGRFLTDPDEMLARVHELTADVDRTRRIGAAGLDVLLAEPRADPSRVAAIGFCYGGTLALELGRAGADLKAIVGFHPGLSGSRPGESRNIVGKVLVCTGSEDPIVSVGRRLVFEEEMRAAGVDWRMYVFGGALHSFTRPQDDPAQRVLPGVGYDRRSAERSWRAMLDLFEEVFGEFTA